MEGGGKPGEREERNLPSQEGALMWLDVAKAKGFALFHLFLQQRHGAGGRGEVEAKEVTVSSQGKIYLFL